MYSHSYGKQSYSDMVAFSDYTGIWISNTPKANAVFCFCMLSYAQLGNYFSTITETLQKWAQVKVPHE